MLQNINNYSLLNNGIINDNLSVNLNDFNNRQNNVAYSDDNQINHMQNLNQNSNWGPMRPVAQVLVQEEKEETLVSSSRNKFIGKVYTLLSIQLGFTILLGAAAINVPEIKTFFANTIVSILVSVSLLTLSLVMCCCIDLMRKYGLIFYIIFTVLFSLLVGITIGRYNTNLVVLAALITTAITIGLTMYACLTKTDFTELGPYLLVVSIALLGVGIAAIFTQNKIVHLIYAALGSILFGIYLIYDTQLVIGTHSLSYSFDDAYFAAIMLYIDIIQMFINILRLLSAFQ